MDSFSMPRDASIALPLVQPPAPQPVTPELYTDLITSYRSYLNRSIEAYTTTVSSTQHYLKISAVHQNASQSIARWVKIVLNERGNILQVLNQNLSECNNIERTFLDAVKKKKSAAVERYILNQAAKLRTVVKKMEKRLAGPTEKLGGVDVYGWKEGVKEGEERIMAPELTRRLEQVLGMLDDDKFEWDKEDWREVDEEQGGDVDVDVDGNLGDPEMER
ncbi:hypothetical protein FB567DRAFT_540113 [Paraphoma chrysanthemicola]|uniref:Uncharacterized protein n=1 Tax=Paraphoma chrysanthemicola TaxID=798071 RepID=A0A8K0QTF0_9PLEO|nr:hypothetical protein FB567DRAFT_540113 [Paraphoma chrysanthemicola]